MVAIIVPGVLQVAVYNSYISSLPFTSAIWCERLWKQPIAAQDKYDSVR